MCQENLSKYFKTQKYLFFQVLINYIRVKFVDNQYSMNIFVYFLSAYMF